MSKSGFSFIQTQEESFLPNKVPQDSSPEDSFEKTINFCESLPYGGGKTPIK